MPEQFQKNPLAWALGVIVALTAVKVFLADALPWYQTTLGTLSVGAQWIAFAIIALSVGGVVYYGLQYYRYRSALRRIVRDYIVDVADLNTRLDSERYGPMSEGIKRGEESADPVWGNRVVGKYGLPPEKEYR